MKILTISFIVLQLIILVQIYININQTKQINELQSHVLCLRMDKLYVGEEWCVNKNYPTINP